MKTHYVYRAFDAADRLLYVGCTSDVAGRMKTHVATSPWGVYMATYTSEPFDSRADAEAAETRAIAEEFPRWNVVGRSLAHPEGFVTTMAEAAWLRPEREVAERVRRLRSDVDRARNKLRRLLVDLRMEEALVAALSNGSIDLAGTDDAELLGDAS